MEYRISGHYQAQALCEISLDTNGCNYLVIYGSHINGGWCVIPNWNIGCEMGTPSDTFFNAESLVRAGLSERPAKAIAAAIADTLRGSSY